jgi:flavodoxin I
MKTLVVYDSTYGNTEKIAKAIGTGIAGDVRVLRTGEAGNIEITPGDLLIAGSPTQGFNASVSVRKYLDNIPAGGLNGVITASFDTRMPSDDVGKGLRFIMKVGGYAAPRIAVTLKKKGGSLIVPPECFFVKGKEGPLKDGEPERATKWAVALNSKMKDYTL